MKTLKTTAAGVFLIASLGAPSLFAAEQNEGSPWYIGAGLGISSLNPDDRSSSYKLDDNSGSGYKIFAGYDYSDRLSLEGYYADLGEASMLPDGELAYTDMGASALYYFSRDEDSHQRLGPYVKAGVGFMKNSSKLKYKRVHSTHLSIGAGMFYRFDNGLVVRGDIDLFDKDSSLASINLIKQLDGSEPARKNKKDAFSVDGVKLVALPSPMADSDMDGAADHIDICPGTIPGLKIDSRGCPSSWVIEGLQFIHDKDELSTESKVILTKIAQKLVDQKTSRHIQIEGHTDSIGAAIYNQELSQQRATAVLKYLVSQGVDTHVLSAVGKGEKWPIADNINEYGRTKNRRVELRWK